MNAPDTPNRREATIEECARCVPTSWLDALLTGPNAIKPPIDESYIERLLLAIQTRIRALSTKAKP
jgi:hypothetical protein